MATPSNESRRNRVQAHRDRQRAQGLRPIQIWVPDVRSRAFESEALRQALAVRDSEFADADQGFIDAIADSDE